MITSNKISVGPPFYHKLIIPALIPFLVFMAIGPKLNWIRSELKNKLYLFVFLIISLTLSFFITKHLDNDLLINTVLIAGSLYLFFITAKDFLLKRSKNLQQKIAHFGFSMLILSILLNNIFSAEIITNLKIGETFKNDKIEIAFNSLSKTNEKNYLSLKGNFSITEKQHEKNNFEPELRVYNQPNIVTSEADIKTTLFTDRFITMNKVQNDEYFNIRYQVKPFMIWI